MKKNKQVNPKEIPISLSPELKASPLYLQARRIVATLHNNGYEGFLVGGFVRDIVLGNTVADIDIATNATPDAIQKLFRRTFPVGVEFGVVIVRMAKLDFQVATFRQDFDYQDGRRPTQVIFSTISKDVLRRDFTVNGLVFDSEREMILDWVEGIRDIRGRTIRAIGEPATRFAEDKLRMLRAVRFAANLDFSIDKKTWTAIKSMASLIQSVSKERIREELEKMLTHGHSATALRLLDESGLLPEILPEVARLKGVEQPKEFHPEGDVFIHVSKMLDLSDQLPLAEQHFSLKMAILLHDVGKPDTQTKTDRIRFHGHDKLSNTMTREILKRLKCSSEEIDIISAMVAGHMNFMQVSKMKKSTLRKFMAQDHFDLHLELHRVDCLSSHGKLDNYQFLQNKMAELEKMDQAQLPPPLVNGADLIAMGLSPSVVFKEILATCYEQQLEDAFANKEEALLWVKKFIEEKIAKVH